MRTSLNIRTLAILACIAVIVGLIASALFSVLGRQPDEPAASSASHTSGASTFEVRVIKPRSARPLFGIIPSELEAMLLDEDLRFDDTSPGAKIGGVENNQLELNAEGWKLFIKIDDAGKIASETHLVFSMPLGGRTQNLRCSPGDQTSGYLDAAPPIGSNKVDGRFRIKLATCANAQTGGTIAWPPTPLTVQGSFTGL